MTRIMLFVSHLALAAIAAFATYLWIQPTASVGTANNQSQSYFDDFTLSSPSIAHAPTTPSESFSPGSGGIFSKQLAAHQLAAVSGVKALEQNLSEHLRNPDRFYHENIAFIFLERLIELDVRAALSFVDRSNADYEKKKQLYASIVTSWIRDDPRSAVDYFLDIRSIDLKQSIGARLLLDQTLAGSPYLTEVKNALGARGEQLLARIAQQRTSPSDAFSQALQSSRGNHNGSLLQAASRWYRQDAEAALQAILNITDPGKRSQIFGTILRIEARDDAFAALELLRTHMPDEISHEANLMQLLVAQDPTRGLPILEEYVSRTGNINIMAQAVSAWARTDPRAAIAYASVLEPDARQVALASASMAYLSAHPNEAMDWVMSLGDRQIQRNAFNSLPHINEQLAEDWLRRSTDDEASSWLLQGLAGKKSQLGLDAAMSWLADYRDNPGYPNAMTSILTRHAHESPSKVATLLEQNADQPQMRGVFSQISRSWAATNPEAALTWIEELPSGSNRDSATGAYIMSIAQRDQDLAIEMVDTMPINNRKEIKMGLAHLLIAQNPREADAIARQFDLPPEFVERIQNGYSGMGGTTFGIDQELMALPH